MIQVRQLARSFGSVAAVRDVSFDAPITGLLGRNGAGKTTTLELLGGLLHPQRGSVRIDGVLWISRGDGKPLGQTTAAFVEISIPRCRASAEWPVLLGSLPMIAIGWVGFPMAIVAATVVIRRKRSELAGACSSFCAN